MSMLLNRNDVDELLHFAALSAATRVGITDAEWEPLDRLVDAVVSKSDRIGGALEAFISTYVSWFAYSEQIDAEGKSGNLSPQEHEKLLGLITQRDTRRNEFIEALKGVV